MPKNQRVLKRRRVLLLCGSLNQTTQLHQIGRELPDWDLTYTPFYGTGLVELFCRFGLAESTIAGEKLRQRSLSYMESHGLAVDFGGRRGNYDLVIACSDLAIPANILGIKLAVVQEGILDPERLGYRMATRFPFLPRWVAGTAMTGQSGAYDRFFVASEGYRQHFIERGADPDTVIATGIPNFDNCASYLRNSFPYRGYVLVCTSDARETFKWDSRYRFLRRVEKIARGRPVVFKLHPNEAVFRATREIHSVFPQAKVFSSGSAEEMIANCEALVTQYSSTVFVGLALGKEVHSYFDLDELRRLAPLQNGGTSAAQIAQSCRELLGDECAPQGGSIRSIESAVRRRTPASVPLSARTATRFP